MRAASEQERVGAHAGTLENGGVRESRLPRVRASELVGRGWLNTGGRTLTLADLRGKIVVLDFWTFCCINCLHVLDELRELEEQHRDVLVIVGVHSPKFVHEADPVALAAAVERYEVHHPVLDDPDLVTWSAYTARAWPTLVVIDPEGYVVAQMAGEGHRRNVEILVGELVAEHEAKGTLHRGDGPYVPPAPDRRARCGSPPRRSRCPSGNLLVADAGHHASPSSSRTARRSCAASAPASAGSSTAVPTRRGSASRTACAWCPTSCGRWLGYDVLVADTVNHALRGVRLADGRVTTVAGTGEQYMVGAADNSCRRRRRARRGARVRAGDRRAGRRVGGVRVVADRRVRRAAPRRTSTSSPGPRRQKLSSPWDVAWSPAARRRSSSRWPATTRCGRSTTSRARSTSSPGR